MNFKIGIPLVGGSSWHGGITYVEALLRAFRMLPKDEQPMLYLLAGKLDESAFRLHRYLLELIDEVVFIGYRPAELQAIDIRIRHREVGSLGEIDGLVDFIFPVNTQSLVGFSFASWIPDLQHKRMPEFFAAEDIKSRDKAINFVLDTADTVILSSHCTKRDFLSSYGEYEGKIEVVHFHTGLDMEIFSIDPAAIAREYGLPERYIICCNQFWRHKNHDNLFKALALSREPVNLVCTGAFTDYRNTDWFAYLNRLIIDLNIGSRVFLLGYIPRDHQIHLIRKSVCVVQPSLFEGWSTVLEDARSLGKPVVASNIDVHREQAVANAAYFDPASPNELSSVLDELWVRNLPQPDLVAEQSAQKSIANLQIASARHLLEIAKKQAKLLSDRKRTQMGARWVRREQLITSECYKEFEQLFAKEEVIQQKEAVIQQKEAVIQQKEAVIQQQVIGIRAYQMAYGGLSPLGLFARIVRRSHEIMKPRLGQLSQYAARSLSLHQCKHRNLRSKSPRISIVTPSYRQGHYIERTILSILNQSYPNLQYFVKDGGSRDGTVEVLKRYEEKLSGWISAKDSGQSQAINLGFDRTDGEIMAWLNSDDLLLPGSLDLVADYFNRNPEVDVVYGNRLMIDENDREIGRWILPGHDSYVLSWADYVPQETLFWRRRIWEKVGGRIDESFSFAMDWDLLVRFRDAGARFGHIPRFLGAFRIHENQKTSAFINEIGCKEMNRIRKSILGRVPDRKEIHRAVLPYLIKHIAVDMGYRVKKLMWRNV